MRRWKSLNAEWWRPIKALQSGGKWKPKAQQAHARQEHQEIKGFK
jgi:hypothetical protein